MSKICVGCLKKKPNESFRRFTKKNGYAKHCNKCENIMHKFRRMALKMEIIDSYGGKCECCDEKRIEFLTVEHKNGDGKEHRSKVGKTKVMQDLKRRRYPKNEGITILCLNCNWSTRLGKPCQHTSMYKKRLLEDESLLKTIANSNRVCNVYNRYFALKNKLKGCV